MSLAGYQNIPVFDVKPTDGPFFAGATRPPGAPSANTSAWFTIVEGIFFSGAFCTIFWLTQRGSRPLLLQ
jgi:hypothetical protein